MLRRHPVPLIAWALVFAASARAQWNPLNPVQRVERRPDGALFTLQRGTLRLRVCADSIVRVTYSPTATFPQRPHYVVIKTQWPPTPWTFKAGPKRVTLATSRLAVTVTRSNGMIDFATSAGKQLYEDASRALPADSFAPCTL